MSSDFDDHELEPLKEGELAQMLISILIFVFIFASIAWLTPAVDVTKLSPEQQLQYKYWADGFVDNDGKVPF